MPTEAEVNTNFFYHKNLSLFKIFPILYKLSVASMVDTINQLTQYSFPKPSSIPTSIAGLTSSTSLEAGGGQVHNSGQIDKGGNM